ncbi:MAG: histidine kinase dimerization/phospho-acceptor domain-containing protein, partial [Acidimicrobiia bacterium]
MASRAFQTLLASSHEASLPHRIVVRIGTAAAWIVVALYLLAGALTGNDSLFVQAGGPVLAGTLMGVQIAVGREDGGLALLGSGLIVAAWSSFFGDEGTMIPAAVALVLTASLGMLFVTQFRALVAATMAVVLFGLPSLWGLSIDEMVILGSIMAVSFVMTHFILGAIQSRSLALNARYQMLFDESPTAVLEEDWSEAVAYVRSEYTGKPERIRQFLLAYPTVVRVAVGKAKVLRANEAAMSLLGITSPARFLGYRNPDVITEENLHCFVSALVSLYEDTTTWEQEVPMRTKTGELQWLLTRSVDTSPMAPATSIVVALADVTHVKASSEAMAEMVRAKDDFIANVSHELRTPLTAVVGLTAELARSERLNEEERAELLELVVAQAGEMSN